MQRAVKKDFHDAASLAASKTAWTSLQIAAVEDGPIGFRGRRGDIGPRNLDAVFPRRCFPSTRGIAKLARASLYVRLPILRGRQTLDSGLLLAGHVSGS